MFLVLFGIKNCCKRLFLKRSAIRMHALSHHADIWASRNSELPSLICFTQNFRDQISSVDSGKKKKKGKLISTLLIDFQN